MGPLLSLILLAVVASAERLHSRHAPDAFCQPRSSAVDYVDPYVFSYASLGEVHCDTYQREVVEDIMGGSVPC